MKKLHAQRLVLAAAAAGAAVCAPQVAYASNPLEYPDNGSASFSRGGAWLAVANEPIATHYNPAALATQGSGFSVEQQLNFNSVCYNRHGPNDTPESPVSLRFGPLQYVETCNARKSFPSTIPSISVAWRVSEKLGIGAAIVPPAAYGTPDDAFPPVTLGYNAGYQECVRQLSMQPGGNISTCGQQYQTIPAPYRYQQLNQLSTIIFPTLGIGYEILPRFRIGAAFVSGIAVINTTVMGTINGSPGLAENAGNDSMSTLRTRDLFIPGAILSMHWSATPNIDLAAWGRVMDSAQSSEGELNAVIKPYKDVGDATSPAFSELKPICQSTDPAQCNTAQYVNYAGAAFRKFKFPIPPEVRIGIRFHQPRSQAATKKAVDFGAGGFAKRDPLKDDVFDIELDGSYSMNSAANTIEVRFAEAPNGTGARSLLPNGYVPPNADKWNGFKDSFGVRLGGQVNVVPDKFGVRAGTWIETRSQEPEWLSVAPVGAMRGGVGGGVVFRQDFIDISIGYQYHWSSGLDNNGMGRQRAVVGNGQDTNRERPDFSTAKEPPDVTAADRTQFRSNFTVNNGSITQHAHAFTLGGTVRF
jgi:hypothetical protein